MRTHLSLFTGIGGLDLAAEAAGFTTVGQCEWADYPTRVLEKHWPDVPRWMDIRTLGGESFYGTTGLRTVDLISGGFPCQPFSVAGKQKGKGDDRYLWPEMLRVIRELAPRWVVGENVPGILRIAAADIVQDLEREGYNAVVFDFEAAAVGALHRRERVMFVANTSSERLQRNKQPETFKDREPHRPVTEHSEVVSNTNNRSGILWRNGEFPAAPETQRGWNHYRGRTPEYVTREWWKAEPGVGRVADGISNRVDRLKCLGNAVVPQQFYPIFKAIMEVES